MLNNNNNHNSSCMFQDVIVSYIYDETTVKEKLAFETHLKNCLMCADELAGFGFVRSSLTEWRETEVFALEMPRLENPAMKTGASIVSTTSSSWLDNLRELVAWFPAWKTASVAFAVLIVVVMSAMFFMNSSNNNEVVSNTDRNSTKESPESNKIQENLYSASKDSDDTSKKTSEIVETVSPKGSPAKISNGSQKQKVNVPKSNETVAQSNVNKEEKKNKTVPKREVPTLTNIDIEEDKSLRLADLFAEIDTK